MSWGVGEQTTKLKGRCLMCWMEDTHPGERLGFGLASPFLEGLRTAGCEAMTVYDQSSMLLWVTDDRLGLRPVVKEPTVLSER